MNFRILDKNGIVTRSGVYEGVLQFNIKAGDATLQLLDEAGDVRQEMALPLEDIDTSVGLRIVYAIGEELAYVTDEEQTPTIVKASYGEQEFEMKGSRVSYYNDPLMTNAYLRTGEHTIEGYINELTSPSEIVSGIKKINRILRTQFTNEGIRIDGPIVKIDKGIKAFVRDVKTNKVEHILFNSGELPCGKNTLARIDAYDGAIHIGSQFVYLFDKESRLQATSEQEDMSEFDSFSAKNKYLYEGYSDLYTKYRLLQSFYAQKRALLSPPSLIEVDSKNYLFEIGSDEEVMKEQGKTIYAAVSALNDFSLTRTYRIPIEETEFTIAHSLIKMMGDPSVCMWLETDDMILTPIVYLSEDPEETANTLSLDANSYVDKHMPMIKTLDNVKVKQTFEIFSSVDSINTYDIAPQFVSMLIQNHYTQDAGFACLSALLDKRVTKWKAGTHTIGYDKRYKRLYINDTDVVQFVGYDVISKQIESGLLTGDYIPISNYFLVSVMFYDRDTLEPTGLAVIQPKGNTYDESTRYVAIKEAL